MRHTSIGLKRRRILPRLFIALDFPEWVKDKLADVSIGLQGADWVPWEQYHLTLRFLGEVDVHIFHELLDGLASLQASSFYLSLSGMGLFPLRGDPEVLWAGVTQSDGLSRLRNKVESLIVRRGAQPDSRKFFPHVTLAKVRNARIDWIGLYIMENSLFKIREIPIQSFSLFSSRLTPEGSIHSLEATYPLEGLLEAE